MSAEEEDALGLWMAARSGDQTTVKRLLSSGIAPDVPILNTFYDGMERGSTALQIAAIRGHVEVVKALLEARATVDTPTGRGYSPLHLACEFSQFAMAALLLEKGADPESRTTYGDTPAHLTRHHLLRCLLRHYVQAQRTGFPESVDGVVLNRILRSESHCPPRAVDAGKLLLTVPALYTPEECAALYARAAAKGFEASALYGGDGRYVVSEALRGGRKCLIDDAAFAEDLFHRVLPFLPTRLRGRRPVGVNGRLRFLGYSPGARFCAHQDFPFMFEEGERKGVRTLLTLQLYLRAPSRGGHTSFLSDFEDGSAELGSGPRPGREDGDNTGSAAKRQRLADEGKVRCKAEVGKLLLFEHGILHEGSAVLEGEKDVLRTDVFFSAEQAEEASGALLV